MFKITHIAEGSIAEEAGINPGEYLISINGKKPKDILDYRIEMADNELNLIIKDLEGELVEIDIEKDPEEDLGLIFEYTTMERERACNNKCIFCFIDQQPPTLRKSLYLKDDDYRLSFLTGSYISLTNLDDLEIERIVKYRLSPLYVSVHTTNDSLRSLMVGNRKPMRIMEKLQILDKNGIELNCQIVLCPGYNDGNELNKTLKDLSILENLKSIAVVPVGLTRYREKLAKIIPVNSKLAREVIELIVCWQEIFMRIKNSRVVFPSDEFYLLAGYPILNDEYYEGFPQLENGVGLISKLKGEILHAKIPQKMVSGNGALLTGKLAEPFLKDILYPIVKKENPNLVFDILAIENNFFGKNITVAGLVTGTDIAAQFNNQGYSYVIIPTVMLKENTDKFLDDMTITQLEEQIKTKIITCEVNGQTLIDTIFGGIK